MLSIALIAVLVGFTASKLRTALVDTSILSKERYVKDIVATVKDINNKGSYEQFLLSVEKFPTISKSSSVIPVLDTGIQKKRYGFQRHALE